MQKDASQKSLVQRNCRYSKTIARPRAETLTDTDHCRSDARHSSTTTTLESAPAPLTMEPEPGAGLPAFAPGQFSMLYVFGVGELPISISGDPHEAPKLV